MINFKLRKLDEIAPWGQEPELSLHWFGLTDGDLWLTFGNETIYEYSKHAIEHWGKETPYNDYYLSRFIEDFSEIFKNIRETIPENLYSLTNDLKKFQLNTQKWLEIKDIDENNLNDFYLEEYDKLISWTYQRAFNSSHLIGGPCLYFFRRYNRIRIVWDSEFTLDNGVSIWTAKDGSFDMDYTDFIQKIKEFGQSFFAAMDNQVEFALAKEWGNINMDKQRLAEEHKERKKEFFSSILLLEQEPIDKTNWKEVEKLINKMTNEIK